MSKFTETISRAIGKSTLFNRTADYLGDKQKRFKTEQALEDANTKLTNLYIELGKTSYNKRPLAPGRTVAIIRSEISAARLEVDELQKAYDAAYPSNPKADCEN